MIKAAVGDRSRRHLAGNRGGLSSGPDGSAKGQAVRKPAILSVDDDPEVSQAITRDLRRHYGADYRIVSASSGAEALRILEEYVLRDRPVALIAADQRMPEMT